MRGLPRVFWLLFAGTLVNRVGSFVVPLFAIYLTEQRGLSPTLAGAVCSLYGLGSLCSGLLGGYLSDRIGRRRTMILGLLWGATAMLMVPMARSLPMVALATFHLALSGDLYRPAIAAAVSDVCGPDQRTRAYGLLFWVVNLGFAIATAIGGVLSRKGFALLFRLDAATTIVYALLVLLWMPETRGASLEREAPRGRLRDALGDRELLRFVGTQALVGLLFQQSAAALPVALLEKGIGPAQYGLVMSLNGALVVLFSPLVTRWIGAHRRTLVLAGSTLLVGVGFAFNQLPLGVAGAALSIALWTMGEIYAAPVTPALVADLAPEHLRSQYQGVQQMGYGACALVGPTFGLAILEHAGPGPLWGTCLGVGTIAAVLYWTAAPSLARRLHGRGAPA